MSEFKVGDLVRGEDSWCISTGIIASLPIGLFSTNYRLIVINSVRKADDWRLDSPINTDGEYFTVQELTKLGLPYSKMLKKHGHKKSWNTVLPKPSLEPKVGSFVKIIGNSARACHHFEIGSYAEITNYDGEGYWGLQGEIQQYVHVNDFKVLI